MIPLSDNTKYRLKIGIVFIFIISVAAGIIHNLLLPDVQVFVVAGIINLITLFLVFTKFYLTVRKKFIISLIAAILWMIFSYNVADKWINDFADIVTYPISIISIFVIAILPGFINAFMVSSLLLDLRPKRRNKDLSFYPGITILIAAYNEQDNISSTIESIAKQDYPGELHAIVINDGSKDDTSKKVEDNLPKYPWLKLINLEKNKGKSEALREGLKCVKTDLTITIDGDSYLFKDALKRIVERYLSDPKNTAAVAGAVLVRNSRKNLVTKVQEWDYFHGIAAVKRIQSLYQGTLVAQGAFSLYETKVLHEINSWPSCVGEDIVLTWSMLNKGYRIGYAEDACLFTNAPDTWKQFIRQRQRWSRGLVEAFKENWQLLFKCRMTTLFIWLNASFFILDLTYTFVFIPGIILALFGIYWIAGPLTLFVLPLAMIVNYIMFNTQIKMFNEQGLKVRKNLFGFIFYSLFYGLIVQPACVVGYLKELFMGSKKTWGTK